MIKSFSRLFLPASVMLALLVLVDIVSAHPLSISYSRFTPDQNGIEAVYRLPLDDMDLLLRLDTDLDDNVSPDELLAGQDRIVSYLREHSDVSTDGTPLIPRIEAVTIWEDSNEFHYLETRVQYIADAYISELELNLRFLTHLYPGHRNLAELEFGEQSEQFVFQLGNSWTGVVGVTSAWRTIREFTKLGVEHIFTGYDHILFLLGLLLVGRSLRDLLFIVTSFTIAHSLTLALATLGLVQPAGWIIEAAIALSIVYVGLENLLVKEVKHRWRLTFLFGLVHGFGFAGILQQMNLQTSGLLLSLFSFNVGVEIGQIIIVGLFWPLLVKLGKSTHRLLVVRLISTVILIFGILWFLERAL